MHLMSCPQDIDFWKEIILLLKALKNIFEFYHELPDEPNNIPSQSALQLQSKLSRSPKEAHKCANCRKCSNKPSLEFLLVTSYKIEEIKKMKRMSIK